MSRPISYSPDQDRHFYAVRFVHKSGSQRVVGLPHAEVISAVSSSDAIGKFFVRHDGESVRVIGTPEIEDTPKPPPWVNETTRRIDALAELLDRECGPMREVFGAAARLWGDPV